MMALVCKKIQPENIHEQLPNFNIVRIIIEFEITIRLLFKKKNKVNFFVFCNFFVT